jgi:hypothetical protein
MKLLKSLLIGLTSISILSVPSWSADKKNESGPNRVFGAFAWNNLHVEKNFDHSVSFDATKTDTGGVVTAFTDQLSNSRSETIDLNIMSGWAGYEYSRPDATYLCLRGAWGGGKGDWDKSNEHVFEHQWFAEGRVGYQFSFGMDDEFGFTPYVGFSFHSTSSSEASKTRTVTDTADNSTLTGTFSNKEKTRKQDVDVGILFNWNVMENWSVGLNLEAFIDVWGRSKTDFDVSQVTIVNADGTTLITPTTTDFSRTIHLKSEINWLAELPITYKVNSQWDFSFVPFYNWNKINPDLNNDTYTVTGSDAAGDTYTLVIKDTYTKHKITAQNSGARLEIGYRF